ncbi:MAG: hypothetical protein KC800_30500, partial [Candidatus Eremiobacteraeota bacterium]|nr:hypothetical protein [Candidatus Eremiobacteraeota bacterium]
HEGLCFACGSYYHILGFSAEAGLQTGLKVWHRATHEVPISGHSPIPENPKDVENLLRRYIGFYARPLTTAEDDDCTDSLRALILRQLMAGEEYYPIQEFILCTSIEGFVSIAEPALDDGREKDLKFLKKQLKEFLAIQPEVSDDTCSEGRRVNIERLKSYIGSMGFRTTRGLMEAFFSEAGLVWNDAYGRAWSRIRNPSAHGTQVSLDQSRVTNFLISIELWNLLILGLIGYDGEVRRYGATGCFGSFPSSPIKNLPDHLLVPSVPSKKGTKQPKGRFF